MKYIPIVLIALAGCQDLNSNSTDRTRYGDTNLEDNGNVHFIEAYQIINSRCANCHTSTVHNKWSSFTSNNDWLNESTIDSGNPDTSSFIQRMQNFSNANSSNMPLGSGPIPDEEYQKLRDWISSL